MLSNLPKAEVGTFFCNFVGNIKAYR